jgi:4-hydroxy-tetrahydrodipicolinate synthase
MNLNETSLWTAVVTPFLNDGQTDFESLTLIIQEQDEARNGLLILGSTAEALNLNLNRRKEIVEHVVKMNLHSPIMVGVGGHLIEEQKEWIRYLEGKSIHAYLLVTPHYAKPGPEGQYHWFKELLDQSTRPCMLYNVPGRSAVALSFEAVKRLSGHQHFWSIKEASGSVEKCIQYLEAAKGHPVFCGDDALMPDFAEAGCAGLISVASNAWPKETHLYVQQCLKKTFDAKEMWTRASNSLFICSNPVPVKRLMFEQGKMKTPLMMPPLSHEDMTSWTEILEAQKNVASWYEKEK